MSTYFKSFILLVGLMMGLLSCGKNKESADTITTKVVKTDIIHKVTTAGKVVPKQTSLLTAPYDGQVRKLMVKIGQKVKEGDPLISISESTAMSGVSSWPMRAPFSGTITHLFYKEGEFVDSKDSEKKNILRIDNMDEFFVEAQIAELDIAKLKKGQRVIIKFSAFLDKTYEGVLETISLAPRKTENWRDNQVQFPAMIKVLNPDEHLRPGLSVILDLIIQKKEQVLALPHHYIGKEEESYYVMNKKTGKKNIKVGLHSDEFFEITEGVELGEEVNSIAF